MKTSAQLRQGFLDYFIEHQHRHVASSPIVPPDDPTLLFTTAGMVQFKALYTGSVELPYTRACTVQKCLRAGGKGSDLENVGRTLRHHTFFEMLGNFSFGDYFKREAIQWAWDFSTKVVNLDPTRIYASVFDDDDEAWDIWTKEIGVPAERMVRLGAKDNFWGPAGDAGACGPCSELYYDRGEQYGPGLTFQHATLQDDDPNTRYIEFWNTVFPQFDQQKDGTRLPLKNRGVDTGMGLERLTCIVQNARSLYETDILFPGVERMSELMGIGDYKSAEETVRQSVNVVVDHTRALLFALSEGILPGNEGRGYVLRRLLRRAARYARKVGQDKPFMYEGVDVIADTMGAVYPEVLDRLALVKRVVRGEEVAYAETVGTGLQRLETILSNSGQTISGDDAFTLASTYGLPIDDILEVARERSIAVDTEAYGLLVAQHREISRSGGKGTKFEGIYESLKATFEKEGRTQFLGYPEDAPSNQSPRLSVNDCRILALFTGTEEISRAETGTDVAVVLARTPFYAESGGQVGDAGTLHSTTVTIEISDTQKTAEDVFVHYGRITRGAVDVGENVTAEVDETRRLSVMRHHTATHLMQGALKRIVGEHVTQQGSLVSAEHLRFDFTNPESVSPQQLLEIESLVNAQILRNAPVVSNVMTIDEARKLPGIIAPFGEKYGQRVRVVDIPDWDTEFCGGTHVASTGLIGSFLITSESAISAGVRRIEAVAGFAAVALMQTERRALKRIAELVTANVTTAADRVEQVMLDAKDAKKQIAQLQSKLSASESGTLLENAQEVSGVAVVHAKLAHADAKGLRDMFDGLKSRRAQGLVAILGCSADDRASLFVAATADVVASGLNASEIIKHAAPIMGGSGGGKPDSAQAGGKDVAKLDDAIRAAVAFALEKLQS